MFEFISHDTKQPKDSFKFDPCFTVEGFRYPANDSIPKAFYESVLLASEGRDMHPLITTDPLKLNNSVVYFKAPFINEHIHVTMIIVV